MARTRRDAQGNNVTKADWLVCAGFALLITGGALIYRPLGCVLAGIAFVLLGRAAAQRQRSEAERYPRKETE